ASLPARRLFRPVAPSRLRAAAHRTAVQAFIARTAANHDSAAVGAGRRVLLVEARHTADARHRRAAARRMNRERDDFFMVHFFDGFLFDDADLLLRVAVEKLAGA